MTRLDLVRRASLVVVALIVAVVVDLATGASVPGRMAVFSLGATFVLVLGAKWLSAAFLQRPYTGEADDG